MKKIIIMISLLSALSAAVFAQAVIGEYGFGLGHAVIEPDPKRDFTSISTHINVISKSGLTVSLGLQDSFKMGQFSFFNPIMGIGYTYVHDVFDIGANVIVAPHDSGIYGDVFLGCRATANFFFDEGVGIGADFIYARMVGRYGSIINYGLHCATRF
jgi:opacity protein-like surface antigen